MVKAAVLAMNATDCFLHEVNCGETQLNPTGYPCCETGVTLDRWTLTGGSKRGWTALLALVSITFKMLAPVHHYWRVLGGWSFALKGYYENINATNSANA